MHESYRYAYVTDREEGLLVIDVDCLADGDPLNNFVEKVATFNPNGVLRGAVNLTVAGTTAYVCCDMGIYAIDIDDPRAPRVISQVGAPEVNSPRAITIQFRYAFVCDADGVKVLDVTFPENMSLVPGAGVQLPEALDIYVARTYGYVAAGKQGLVILDLEKPHTPQIEKIWSADGQLDEWSYEVTLPGDEIVGGTPGTPEVVASGTVDFDAQGRVWTSNSNAPTWQIERGQPRVIRLDPRTRVRELAATP